MEAILSTSGRCKFANFKRRYRDVKLEPSPVTHVQEVMEEGGVDVWLRRWQCIFSLDTGLFYISFLIVRTTSPFPLHTCTDRLSGGSG